MERKIFVPVYLHHRREGQKLTGVFTLLQKPGSWVMVEGGLWSGKTGILFVMADKVSVMGHSQLGTGYFKKDIPYDNKGEQAPHRPQDSQPKPTAPSRIAGFDAPKPEKP